jgi:hypothetical protein
MKHRWHRTTKEWHGEGMPAGSYTRRVCLACGVWIVQRTRSAEHPGSSSHSRKPVMGTREGKMVCRVPRCVGFGPPGTQGHATQKRKPPDEAPRPG